MFDKLNLATLKPGDSVVIVNGTHLSRPLKVATVGKRDVVLEDKSRWSVLHNERSGRRYGYEQLALPNSDRANSAREGQRYSKVVNALRAACNANDKQHLNAEALADLRKAVSAAEAYLAQKTEEN